MSKKINLIVSDDLYKIIKEEIEEKPFDYEYKISVFVRGCVIRRLRELNKIK